MCGLNIILVLSLLGVFGASEGQILQNGQCDENIVLQANFNIEQFLGTWYEHSSTEHSRSGDCSSVEFTRVGTAVTVSHRTVRQNFLEEYFGSATVPTGSARMTLSMPTVSSTPINFWVWLTDYSNLALIYNCENVGATQRRLYIWQLTRQQTATETALAAMNTTMINNVGLNSNDLRTVSRSDDACRQLPVIVPGQPIVLPGQCDENIPVQQNFRVGDFLGVWHQVYRYYSERALGYCNRAQYGSDDGVTVNVRNSQIINQTLSTIDGFATVVSNDSSARLNVVLEVSANVTNESELLILATDYTQWAISYTCNNLENNQKRVFSWIMSRTRTLTPAAQAEVDAVVNSIVDLNYAYFEDSDQSNDACFYVPEVVEEGEAAVFGGQCDQTIPVQPNFVAASYLDLWYLIESFPTPFQSGSCNNAYYSLGDGGVNVLNTQVVNQSLNTIEGLAVQVGNEAKLVVNFPSESTNTTRQSDYWIISTDYLSYSLVYSCNNINEYQQQITMWKLSRSKSLTTAANTAINNAMATQTVFDSRFFQITDQSREACFYFPEANGQPVVFPGQCDDEPVSVVENINLNLFSGQWFEVEAYPKEFQPGVCVEHSFTVAGNTGLNLVSTSVTDQTLGVTSSQLVFTNGTDGRFRLTISNGTSPITIPYEVIVTDYYMYALTYSCVDLNDDFKAIYSWKLSRNKDLALYASNAINAAMANYTVLSNDYFEPMDQSDDGCFYFPDLGPGELVILPGQCESEDNIPFMRNFDADAYEGRWYLIESYASRFQIGQCNRAQYTVGGDGILVVTNSEVANQALRTVTGTGTLVRGENNQTMGKLQITFSARPNFDLYILDTDYENYSLLYRCANTNNNQRQVLSWKMSRTTNLTAESVAAINAVTSNITVLDDRYYQSVDHSYDACFYFPATDGSSTVIFPGQCDENINVVTNFDAVGYMGLWHDVERYPAPFQEGTCGNAFYRLEDGPIVDVTNTQVVNQTLDTIRGSAVLDLVDANDTSAKLLVTFPVAGFNLTTPYWVLATDYLNYALVYSCSNIDFERRSVTSWKLSRTKSLTTAAITAINQVVNTIDVLDDRYYLEQDQTPEGCFYNPEPAPGVPVVFPGVCDVNATVVQNFNISAFQGIWHEIEAYPKEEQGGQCINHQFTVSGTNTMNFESSNIIAQELGVTSGTVRFAFNDNSGRLFLDFVSNGTQITIPYWIIDTDYENYALAYSCVNRDNDQRAVWSWKLSRTQELSNVSRTAIDEAMTDNIVLDNKYFENIDQTNEACFYLPETTPGEPVVFPGRCEDTNITAMPNFDALRYLDRWFLIESYPSQFQAGQCNQARYSLATDGTVIISNSDVSNQTLRTSTGTGTLVRDANNQAIGQLQVTFPASSVPFVLTILDTDYDNYTLAYGCVNLDNNQRQVQSWKMSRTTSLTPQSVAAINAVTSNIDVLNDRYYESVDQSAEACFYFPETDGSSTVIFPGQCDENINVVTNFDAVGYMGLWHDVERYPAPFQEGTCGNAFYRLEDGPIVDVTNTQVVNQTLDTIRGSAVLDLVDANDTSAKLLVTFPVAGFNLTTPYWVLATDYLNYALVYSCSNLDSERRSVTSWKLSRTKSLTTAAITAINQVVNTIDVLDDRYYLEQDQTPEGCFYTPEPAPGVPVVFPGVCDVNATVVQNFNISAFQGIWHEIEAYPKEEQGGQCINHQFTVSGTNTMNFESSNIIAQELGVTSGNVRFAFNDNSGRLFLDFVSNGTQITIPYWIIDTDYENYALAYSCVNRDNDQRAVWSWKLSRTKELSNTSRTAIDEAMTDNVVLDNKYFENIDQTNEACFYLPDAIPGEPVVFPGQCEDTIVNGVPNFDATRYMDRWFLVESYPSRFQAGQCNQARYSLLVDGTVIISNSDVNNQTLRTATGNGTLVRGQNNQPIGQLIVNFPSSSAPFVMTILDTDYISYSLVYGCVNLDNNQRQVQSWKMSRTTSLTAQSVAAINAVTSTIDVLNDRYYESVDQSAEACFYYPESDGSSTVIFPGQCDENIDVVMNFDAARFAGTWYDIESYPAPFQGGACSIANYDLDLTTLVVAVENTQVVNPDGYGPVLDVQTGTAVVASNDTSAKLLVNFEVNGVMVSTDYWVLATDYSSYALVYSCQNIDSEYRQVNSWKMSRSRSLTAASTTPITAAINRVQVLEERYFVEKGHSDEDCFFYPDNEGGDVILDGICVPDAQVPAITGFNANLFSGTWHEVARFPSDMQEGECVVSDYSVGSQNSIIITQTQVDNEIETSNIINGTLSTDGRGVINAEVSGIPFNTFYILDTDYNEYALLYGCRNLVNNTKQVYSWKFSRSRSGLSAAANTRLDAVIRNNVDLFENYYKNTDQSNDACFHYPAFGELPSSIDLPGHCDESIRGVSNFDAERYLGRWIEIERYPQPNQVGTCDRAYYSLGDGNVLVSNTQVIGTTLDEQLGFAEVASTDGSGVLNVTFVVNGITLHANYYILSTDYSNYALVYSCTNLPNDRRLVFSWKLSRSTTLSTQAITAIDAVINQTQGLSQDYYQVTSQSDEACFYIPEVNVNEAPVFRGQCEENVAGMTNFDSARYAGWWHEIERYPVDDHRGECISSQYQTSGTSYLVTDTAVANGSATVSTGTVQVSANGRLRRTIDGVTQDVWVLATDYETYALLYSCQNVDNEFRRIWSAKHSKSRQLTAAAQASMNPVITSNQLLQPQFYQSVDQSNAACFHYPTLTGQQAILPGQCDDNIPVVRNFDVEAYGGTWYQIERYPQTHEVSGSTCVGARYTLQDSGIVTVLNWEVVNGELVTIEGNATLLSTDGSAKLNVVLPIRGSPTGDTVSTELFVLGTDYVNYALAYSCSNVNAFQRSIGVWKLSRERTLSLESQNAINVFINNREELYQPYFVSVRQNEDCEEPSAGALVRSSVVVMIICALWQILS